MAPQDISDVIAKIVEDPALSKPEKVIELERLRQNARAEMRAASESAMVDDADTGDDLKHLDLALEALGADSASIEDSGAATL